MPLSVKEKKYKRILLKLSGEELMGSEGFGIDPKVLRHRRSSRFGDRWW